MSSALPTLRRKRIFAGTPLRRLAREQRENRALWGVAALAVAAFGVVGRMDMDDAAAIEAARAQPGYAARLSVADAVALKREAERSATQIASGCAPLGFRKSHTPEQVARQCTSRDRREQ